MEFRSNISSQEPLLLGSYRVSPTDATMNKCTTIIDIRKKRFFFFVVVDRF